MRILWVGNAPWAPSGYGEQAALFLPRFQAAGHEVAVSANHGVQGTILEWKGMPVYPSDNVWGNTTIGTYVEDFQPDVVIALCDAWVMEPTHWPEHVRQMAIWSPVDHFPLPPRVLGILGNQRIRPIAMSRDGEGWMRRFGLDPLYVPHGVDRTVFKPQPEMRDEVRDMLGVPRDAFLVGMVAANKGNPTQPRKGWPQAFHAFSLFAEEHPDALLYAHTEPGATPGNGIELDTLATVVGCKDTIMFTPEDSMRLGISREAVAAMYQAFDVLLNPSWGEGFGIPILEAQACGVPVIVSDHSAMTELCHAGWLVDGQPDWDELQKAFFFLPFIKSIQEKLEEAYEARDDRKLRDKAVRFSEQYDADLVMEKFWTPTLEALARPREIPPIQMNGKPPGPNRADRRRAERMARAK